MCMRCMIHQQGQMTEENLHLLMGSMRAAYMDAIANAANDASPPPPEWQVTEAELAAIPRNVWRMMAFHLAETIDHPEKQEVAVARLALIEQAMTMPEEAALLAHTLRQELRAAQARGSKGSPPPKPEHN